MTCKDAEGLACRAEKAAAKYYSNSKTIHAKNMDIQEQEQEHLQ
jgi:hypothetical protein